ncbi:MAG: zf-HC2 domain-containing protein [Blastocatellia bacterium]|nr:zf-HC2 domain-containing protein [Blastocatellia bacterium]
MNQMQCTNVRELLSTYVDSELDPVTSLRVANHLEGCVGCRQEFEQFAQLNRLFKGAAGVFVDIEPTLTGRAKAINDRVRNKILSELAAVSPAHDQDDSLSEEFFPPVIKKTSPATAHPVGIKRWFPPKFLKKLALVAATVVLTTLLGFTGLIYWAHYSGTLMAGTVRTHWVCTQLDHLGLYRTTPEQTQNLLLRYQIQAPDLSAVGLKFQGVHQCKIAKADFAHLVYLDHANQTVSVFYGGQEAIVKLREQAGTVTPQTVFTKQDGNMRVTAVCTANQDHLWMVAGVLTPEQIQIVTNSICLR